MGCVTSSVWCYVTLCHNASLAGPRYIYCVVFICIHSSHTTASSPSKLCRILKSALIQIQRYLAEAYRRCSKILLHCHLISVEQSSESSDLASTFALFKDYFDKKLTALKRDIQEDSLSNSDSIAKKLKEESKISFKFQGNKKQFYFNSDLAEKVHAASTALGKRKLEAVRGYLEELDSDIKKRNKLIRLADKSAAGWDLVNEYLSDELASGSEDEKRIRRAEQRALLKIVNNRKGSPPSSRVSHLPPPLRLLANLNSTSGPLLASLHLLAKQNLATFVSRAVSKVIGGPSAGLTHNSGPQVLASQILVSPQTLEVNKILPANLSYQLSIYFIYYT